MKLDKVTNPKKDDIAYKGWGKSAHTSNARTSPSHKSEYFNCSLSLRTRRRTNTAKSKHATIIPTRNDICIVKILNSNKRK